MLITAKKNNTKKMLIILISVLAFAIFFNFYLAKRIFGPVGSDSQIEIMVQPAEVNFGNTVSNLGAGRISLSILENDLFINLKKIGSWPVNVLVKGRVNPFLQPQGNNLNSLNEE